MCICIYTYGYILVHRDSYSAANLSCFDCLASSDISPFPLSKLDYVRPASGEYLAISAPL